VVSDPPGWRSPCHHAARRVGSARVRQGLRLIQKKKSTFGERPFWVLYPNGATCYRRFSPTMESRRRRPCGFDRPSGLAQGVLRRLDESALVCGQIDIGRGLLSRSSFHPPSAGAPNARALHHEQSCSNGGLIAPDGPTSVRPLLRPQGAPAPAPSRRSGLIHREDGFGGPGAGRPRHYDRGPPHAFSTFRGRSPAIEWLQSGEARRGTAWAHERRCRRGALPPRIAAVALHWRSTGARHAAPCRALRVRMAWRTCR
jgi:hypothetical protein